MSAGRACTKEVHHLREMLRINFNFICSASIKSYRLISDASNATKEPRKVISVEYVKTGFSVSVHTKQPECQFSSYALDYVHNQGHVMLNLRAVGFHTGMNMICLDPGYSACTA